LYLLLHKFYLFWFSYKYQEKEGKKVFFFPHSTKLEIIWTSVPAIVLAVLIVIGLKNWYAITGDAPKNALEVEVVGKQFNWIFRYKGADDVFGKKYYKIIDEANNPLGLNLGRQ
jgi:cytochrome c oxidase subunit 2